jgi:hypothetical protein
MPLDHGKGRDSSRKTPGRRARALPQLARRGAQRQEPRSARRGGCRLVGTAEHTNASAGPVERDSVTALERTQGRCGARIQTGAIVWATSRPRELANGVASSAERPCQQGLFSSGRRDLNSGPLVPQTSALTRLRHAPYRATIPSCPFLRFTCLLARCRRDRQPLERSVLVVEVVANFVPPSTNFTRSRDGGGVLSLERGIARSPLKVT